MTINIIFMDSSEYQSVQKRFKNVVKYNDAVFFIYQSLLTTMKEIAFTKIILHQKYKEIRTQLNDIQEKHIKRLKHSKEKLIILDQIRVSLHL